MAVLGLCCCLGFSLGVASRGYFLVAVCRLLTTVASLVEEHRLWGTRASVVEAHGFSGCGSQGLEHRLNSCDMHTCHSCSTAYGIFLGQGSNLWFLHWQAECVLLSHQGNLGLAFTFNMAISILIWNVLPILMCCDFGYREL